MAISTGITTNKLKRYNPYGKVWDKWSKWIIKRDGYKCRICGQRGYNKYDFPYPDSWTIYWRPLVPHHLIPVSEGGMNNPLNLVALCRSCHGKIHAGKVTFNG